MIVEGVISLILLLVIYILFHKLNIDDTRFFLRDYNGFVELSTTAPEDVEKYIRLEERKKKLILKIKEQEDTIKRLEDRLIMKENQRLMLDVKLEELDKLYNDLIETIDNIKDIGNNHYSFDKSISMFNIKCVIDNYCIESIKSAHKQLKKIFYLHQIYSIFKLAS